MQTGYYGMRSTGAHSKVMTVGLFPNRQKTQALAICRLVRDYFENHGVRVRDFSQPGLRSNYSGWLEEESCRLQELDLAVVIGGDGTFISAVRYLGEHKVPLLGVNAGTVGFMTQVDGLDITAALQAVLTGACQIEERALLSASVRDEQGRQTAQGYVLNEAVVARQGPAHMITLTLEVGRHYAPLHYRADGIIIATNTGSTGYSMSAGGPVVHPALPSLLITPICPQPAGIPALVIPEQEEVRIRIAGDYGAAALTMDGQVSLEIDSSHSVCIRKAERCIRLLHVAGWDYYHNLGRKIWHNGIGGTIHGQ